MSTRELLIKLSDAFGPAGFEDEVRELIREYISDLVDEIFEDTSGNLIALRKGKSNKRVMLDAHMDEIGFIVSHLSGPFVRFRVLGGIDPRLLPGQRVVIKNRKSDKIKGVIGTIPPHVQTSEEMKKVFAVSDLFIDVGALSEEELKEKGVSIGDPGVFYSAAEIVSDDVIVGKSFDDRAGCAVLIKVLERLKNVHLPFDLFAVFTTEEELGLRGAKAASYNVDPDFSLSIEGTIAVDNPDIPPHKQPSHIGRGPVITVIDKSIVVNPRVVRFFESVAEKNGIEFQYKTPIYGATNAGVIHLQRGGVLSGVVAVPCRYIHSPMSIMRLSDFEKTVELVYNILVELPTTDFLDKKLRL